MDANVDMLAGTADAKMLSILILMLVNLNTDYVDHNAAIYPSTLVIYLYQLKCC